MKIKDCVVMVALLFTSCTTAKQPSGLTSGSSTVDNGGDVIYCRSDDNLKNQDPKDYLEGYYVLDYVLYRDKYVPKDRGFLDATIDGVLPAHLALHFREFDQDYINSAIHNSTKGKYIWKKAKNGVVHLHDEQLLDNRILSDVPPNCRTSQKLSIHQAVIRSKNGGGRPGEFQTYYIDEDVVSKLEKGQLDWLLAHEWLWNFTQDIEVVRNVNAYLNSSNILWDHPDQIIENIKSLGLEFPASDISLSSYKAIERYTFTWESYLHRLPHEMIGFVGYSEDYFETIDFLRKKNVEERMEFICANGRVKHKEAKFSGNSWGCDLRKNFVVEKSYEEKIVKEERFSSGDIYSCHIKAELVCMGKLP